MARRDTDAILADYRTLPADARREVARAAKPALRAALVAVERAMVMDRSPGAMASLLTDGRELQAPHLDLIDNAYRRVAAGHPTRTLITMPPRHGKSQRAARWGPLWYLRRNPSHRLMVASYGADLADGHGRWIRDAVREYGPALGIALRPGSHAANRFDLSGTAGGMVTAGVGGGLTGKGAHLAIVDDPVKDAADAQSPTMRVRLWEWWQAVLLTRIEPGGSVIVIQTRWHEDDLAGRLLADVDNRDDWTTIDLPAIADDPGDALGRGPGEALWPARYDVEELARRRRSVGERVWWSLYQQKPRPMEGGVWQWEWIRETRRSTAQMPGVDLMRIVVAVDPSGGDGSGVGDETGIVAAGRDRARELYVLDDRSGRYSASGWGRAACLLAYELRADAIVVESNYGGDMASQVVRQAWEELRREGVTQGLLMPRIIPVAAKVGKRLRADPVAQLYEQRMVHHVGEWPALELQMVTWVAGMDSPDRMDAAVHALTELADPDQLSGGLVPVADGRFGGRR